jgi:hypothetical protein
MLVVSRQSSAVSSDGARAGTRRGRLCCLPVLLALVVGTPAGAQTVGMAVEAPLGGYFRAGKWIPLSCTLTNQGPPADVQVKAQMRDFGQNPVQRSYELSVSLPSPANRRYSMYVMPPGPYAVRPLEIQLLHARRVIGKQEQALRTLNDGDRLVAVIASEEGGFGGLSGTRAPGGQARGGYPPGYGAPPGASGGPNQGQVQVAYVKPELAPDRAIGYEIADLIILSGVTSALSPAQETALAQWVKAGGTLVVTGGAETGALRTPAMRALLPVEITGTLTMDSVGELGAAAVRNRLTGGSSQSPGDAAGTPPRPSRFVASACRPKPGARSLWVRPGVPILSAWDVGAGQVAFLAADPSRPPLRGWEGLTSLWRGFLFRTSPATQFLSMIESTVQLGGSPGYYYYGQPPALANACLQVSQMDVPGFAFIGLFLLAYIVALVPVNYFVLKRRDRREMAWVTTPGIVFLFSGLAYLIGYGTKGGQIVVAQAGIVEAWAGRSAAPALTYLGLFSPRKTRYDFAAEEGAVPLRPVDTDDSSRRPLRTIQGDTFGLKDVPIDMWDMGLFRGDSVVDLGEGFQADLKLVGGKLVGKVTNRSPFDLEDAVLLTGGQLGFYWGPLRRGQSRTVAVPWTGAITGGILPTAALQTVRGRGAPARMRRALIEPLTSGGGPPGGYPGAPGGYPGGPPGGVLAGRGLGHPVLVGWVTRPLVPARVDGRPVREQTAHLFIVHLPAR